MATDASSPDGTGLPETAAGGKELPPTPVELLEQAGLAATSDMAPQPETGSEATTGSGQPPQFLTAGLAITVEAATRGSAATVEDAGVPPGIAAASSPAGLPATVLALGSAQTEPQLRRDAPVPLRMPSLPDMPAVEIERVAEGEAAEAEGFELLDRAIQNLLGERRGLNASNLQWNTPSREPVQPLGPAAPRLDAAAVAAMLPQAAPPTPAVAPQPTAAAWPSTLIPVPVQQAGWDQAVGERVQWMVGQNIQGAELRLNPAHLGPMEVRLSVQHDQASVVFTAQQGMVREALEAAVPRLREMLGESGLQLVNVDISDQSLAQQRRESEQGRSVAIAINGQGGEDPAMAVSADVPMRTLASRIGAIDLFA